MSKGKFFLALGAFTAVGAVLYARARRIEGETFAEYAHQYGESAKRDAEKIKERIEEEGKHPENWVNRPKRSK